MKESEYQKPLPTISSLNRPYWEGLRRRELRLQRCDRCGLTWYPPAPLCPGCWSRKFTWTQLSGHGRISSWVVFHQAYFRSYEADIPYNVVEVELDEGPRVLANLLGANREIRCGMPVEIVFDDVTEEVTLAKFKPRTLK
jgi:uncharacterized protein